jgi:curved DNA-binding protein CbpA
VQAGWAVSGISGMGTSSMAESGCRRRKLAELRSRDPYKLLGVSRQASADDVRRAYRKLVRKHHPDANPDDPGAEERFKELYQAYEVLSNPEKRRSYDERVRAASQRNREKPRARSGGRPGAGDASQVNLADLFARMGGTSGGRKVSRDLRGEDASRLAKLFGVDLDRLSKLLGEAVTMKAHATFESGRPGASRVPKADRMGDKPPIPRKPPVPPKPPKTT